MDKEVVTEADVWTGMNVVMLKGVTIGRGATISADAVVVKNTPPYSNAGGISAKHINSVGHIPRMNDIQENN